MSQPPPKYDFFPWVVYDSEGTIIGIRYNAPEEAKRAYDDFMRKEYSEEGILIK